MAVVLAAQASDAMSLHVNFVLRRQRFVLNANFIAPDNSITGVSGRSGSGKTSLLRAIAGLETVNGAINWHGQPWQSLNAHQRPLGYVFQEPRLFPHLSVKQNLLFAAKRAADPQPLLPLVRALGLNDLLEHKPQQLSGGQAQRVALARALIQRPALLLLDEPLANLDQAAKRELLEYIVNIKREYSTAMLYVSHGIDELAQACDQVLLMDCSEQQASANRVLPIQQALMESSQQEDPISVLHAQYVRFDDKFQLCELLVGEQRWWLANKALPEDCTLRLRVHARDVSISRDADSVSSIQNRLRARVVSVSPDSDGPHCNVQLSVDGQALLARITRRAQAQLQLLPEQIVYAQVKAAALA